jgi:hypothetical protein
MRHDVCLIMQAVLLRRDVGDVRFHHAREVDEHELDQPLGCTDISELPSLELSLQSLQPTDPSSSVFWRQSQMTIAVWPAKKAQQNDLVRAGHEQLALIAALEQKAKLEGQDPMDGGIELVRIMRLSRCECEDVARADRNSLAFDDVGAAPLLDEDDLQKAMRVRPVNHGVPSANEPARVHTRRAANIAQVFRRNDAGARGRSV